LHEVICPEDQEYAREHHDAGRALAAPDVGEEAERALEPREASRRDGLHTRSSSASLPASRGAGAGTAAPVRRRCSRTTMAAAASQPPASTAFSTKKSLTGIRKS